MSNPRVNSFFSVFTQSVQDEILAFCKRITSTHADVYIFMARKAAAFCDCLEELGLIHLDGYVTTDRSLDICGSWLKDKSIVIVDDAVVSGTTLFTTIQKLNKMGVSHISIQILTVNEKWYNPELLEADDGSSYVYPVHNNLPDNECIKLCNDIVHSISLVPRPYDVDFPLYKSFTIDEHRLNRILSTNNWSAYDISTALQQEHGILNYTLIPNAQELLSLSNILGFDITNNSLVKIRLYARCNNKDKRIFSLRISPFFIFEEMDIRTTEQLFNFLVSSHYLVDASLFSNWESTTQLRFLQFYYSNQLVAFWISRINYLLSTPIELTFSYRNLSFLFPEMYIESIEKLCKDLIKIPSELKIKTNQILREHNPETIYHATDPLSLNARLYEPFIDMYHEKEIPCRTLVLNQGKKVFFDPQYHALRNRLNVGLSFQDLLERLRDCANDYDITTKVSLFIDCSIDAGIIVPIIQQVGSVVFRAYRHGEDVLFGRREELMYIKMLALVNKHSGSENGISKLSAEKLIVLFSKIGLRRKLLHPYTSNFISEPFDSNSRPLRILRVKPYLKGPVSLLGTALQHQRFKNIPYITSERKALWLTNILIQNKCLTPNKDNNKYCINDSTIQDDLSLLTDEENTFVEIFAELVGRIINPKKETGVNYKDNDWTKIAITLTLPDTVTAIAAEMELFYNSFDFTKILPLTGDRERDYKTIKYFSNDYAFESVHSAAMKVDSFSKRKGHDLIKAVQFDSSIEQKLWLSYFSEELNNNSENNNEQLVTLFYEHRVWVYLMEAIIDSIFIALTKRFESKYNTPGTSPDRLTRAESRIKQAIAELDALRISIPYNARDAVKMFRIFDSLSLGSSESGDFQNHYDMLIRYNQAIEELEPITNNLKETTCDMLGEKGKINEILRYTAALHVNLTLCPSERHEEANAIIESAFRKELTKIQNSINSYISHGQPVPSMRICELPQRFKPQASADEILPGIWYIGQGPMIDSQITSLAMNIFYKLTVNGIDCQVSIFDNLKYDVCIKSNSSEHAEFHCNQFNTFIDIFRNDTLFPTTPKHPMLVHICPTHLLSKSRANTQL